MSLMSRSSRALRLLSLTVITILLISYSPSDCVCPSAACNTSQCAVQPSAVLKTLGTALTLFQNNTVFTLGQNEVFAGAMLCNSNVTAAISSNMRVACPAPTLMRT
jgi:hypothetical protein